MNKNSILVIPDTHGIKIIDKLQENFNEQELNDFRKIVFLGDYLDSFDISPAQQKDELEKIISFKKSRENVILLLGNHDVHYLLKNTIEVRGTGYNKIHCDDYHEILKSAYDQNLFDFLHFDEKTNTLYSHAGLTKSTQLYINDVLINSSKSDLDYFEANDFLKNNFASKEVLPILSAGPMRGKMSSMFPGITWTDEFEWKKGEFLNKVFQVVGHTHTNQRQPLLINKNLEKFYIKKENFDKTFQVIPKLGTVLICDYLPYSMQDEHLPLNFVEIL